LQHELALERGNRDADFLRLLWIPAGLSAQNASYREFISYLQNDPSVYEGAEVLSGTNLEDLKTVIQKRLVDQRQKLEPVSEGRRVYLICDKQDLQAVGPIRDYLFAEGFEVILPFKGEAQGLSGHRENLRVCDAVLIFYGTANTVDYKLMELRRMDVLRDSRPLLAKGIYVGGPETDHKRVFTTSEAIVIKNFGEFTPESLKPFIEQFAETPKAKPF
jgi:hypothetical protein